MEKFPEAKRGILLLLKEKGPATIGSLAEALSLTREGARKALLEMASEGWVSGEKAPSAKAGRPEHRYRLTVAGEHLFPKAYDALTLELLDRMGDEALRNTLTAMTEARVKEWEPKLKGKDPQQRLKALKGLYWEEDPHMSVERGRLVERNCPFMNVAARRPALCSVTVSTLSRLVGRKVERVESFQAGHGRCVFNVLWDQPASNQPFEFEAPPPASGG